MSLLRCYVNIGKGRGKTNRGNNGLINFVGLVLVLCLGEILTGVEGSLPLRKKCDEDYCQGLEYCRQLDHNCQPCEDICVNDSSHNNFDEDRCVSDCQDYIHDVLYVSQQNSSLWILQRQELEDKYIELEKDVFFLKLTVGVCVAVIIAVVGCLIAFFVYFWKLMHPSDPGNPGEKKKSAVNKAASVELPTVYNNRYGVTTPTPETSPSSVISSSPADTNITTSTTVPPSYHAQTPTSEKLAARHSPTKSESSMATPGTISTGLMSSAASTIVNERRSNGGIPAANRFRREPSESTLPENCAYDNLSMSPQHCHYSVHV